MARKSGWQQFADNFNSVYGAFRDVAKEWEYDDINKAKLEEIQVDDPDNNDDTIRPSKWSYLGQEFDEKPTADQMRGLKYQAMSDVMAKYGDVKGAMDMQMRREDIQAKQDQNKLFSDTYKYLVDKARLANEGKQSDINQNDAETAFIQGPKTDYYNSVSAKNDAQTVGIGYDNQFDRDTLMGRTNLENRKNAYQLGQYNYKVDGLGTEGDIHQVGLARKLGEEQYNKGVADYKNENLPKEATLYGDTLDRGLKENQVKMVAAENAIAQDNLYKDVGGRIALGWGAEGGFANTAEADAALIDGMYKIGMDPKEIMAFQQSTNEHERLNIVHDTSMYAAKANQAYQQGGVQGLQTVLDDINGPNRDIQLQKDKKTGEIRMYETGKDGYVRDIISAKSEEEFKMNLQKMLQPNQMWKFAADQAAINKADAAAEYDRARTAAAKKGKALSKDEWATSRLAKNPGDPLGLAILLGDGYDMDTINEMAMNAVVNQSAGSKSGNRPGEKTREVEVPPVPVSKEEAAASKEQALGLARTKKAAEEAVDDIEGNWLTNIFDKTSYNEALDIYTANKDAIEKSGMDADVRKKLEELRLEEEESNATKTMTSEYLRGLIPDFLK